LAHLLVKACILVELVDGSMDAYDYPDEESAESWYVECRQEWNAERTVLFNLRTNSQNRFSPLVARYDSDQVSHLELTTRKDAEGRGALRRDAVLLG
jgi:hypothetical protein